ncbi:cob(I)alamin adenosyltransferase [Spiroplasma sp. TIUS-1]|uniref:cob(I)yrinic acid a,c-diamide adenosyltransferase n=1 Tax=Spiroplasma sp. TIUS-1 TaxID=216963 RepID=UPI0013996F60|nr:cob(I)yrinic acid a,c-diamide adenosyltransferase [Spiroplasma sp. TIUS-1]QHX35841.1 cob(I)alamin adenosyltransferase [Spiroplasma sp. TIUS-1]
MKKTKGYLHIYCGEGKGKTSILNGSAIRAKGAGFNVEYFRFLKNRPTAENIILEKLGIKIDSLYKFSTKFIWEMNEQEAEVFKTETYAGYLNVKKALQNPKVDVILIDELLGAVENGFISKTELINDLKNRLDHIEVLVSGRYSFNELDNLADLISVITPKKHYMNIGVSGREGIEY